MTSGHIGRRKLLAGATATVLASPVILHPAIVRPFQLNVASLFPVSDVRHLHAAMHEDLVRAATRGDIRYAYYDQVPASEYEVLFRQISEQNYDLIVADAQDYHDIVANIVTDFPSRSYLLRSSRTISSSHTQIAIFDDLVHEASYLAGIISSGFSRTKTIGCLGSSPAPSSNRNVNSFIQGAKEINPDIRVVVDSLDSNPDDTAINTKLDFQLGQGVDIVYAEKVDTEHALDKRNIKFVGNVSDRFETYPQSQVTATLWYFRPILHQSLKRMRENSFRSSSLNDYSGLRHGGSSLAPLRHNVVDVPEDVLERAARRYSEIHSGTFVIAKVEMPPVSDF